MSRIRSIFPSQWTDPLFLQMTPVARLFSIAVRNECDDHGIFKWEPITLKIKLIPFDPIDILDVLKECVMYQQILPFEVSGRRFGAVRNFLKFQKPRHKSYEHPMTDLVEKWVLGHALPEGSDLPLFQVQRALTPPYPPTLIELNDDSAGENRVKPAELRQERLGEERKGEEGSPEGGVSPQVRGTVNTEEKLEERLAALDAVIEHPAFLKQVARYHLVTDAEAQLDDFKAYCRSRPKLPKYRDWVSALRNSFRWRQDDLQVQRERANPKVVDPADLPEWKRLFRAAFVQWEKAGSDPETKPNPDDFEKATT